MTGKNQMKGNPHIFKGISSTFLPNFAALPGLRVPRKH